MIAALVFELELATRLERTVKTAKSVVSMGADVLWRSPRSLATAASRGAHKAQEIAGWLEEESM